MKTSWSKKFIEFDFADQFNQSDIIFLLTEMEIFGFDYSLDDVVVVLSVIVSN